MLYSLKLLLYKIFLLPFWISLSCLQKKSVKRDLLIWSKSFVSGGSGASGNSYSDFVRLMMSKKEFRSVVHMRIGLKYKVLPTPPI